MKHFAQAERQSSIRRAGRSSKAAPASTTSDHGSLRQAAGYRCACAGGCPRCTTGSQGQRLDAGVRRSLEASYHAQLGDVRVHTGPTAHELTRDAGANAMTSGNDIYFARDRYSPHTAEGWRRIAHEVAHVVQQRRGVAGGAGVYGAAETEARQGAARAYDGRETALSHQSGGLLQREEPETTPASPDYQLQLDPEIQRMALQYYLRWWIGTSLTEGEPSAAPVSEESEAPPAEGTPVVPPVLSPWLYQVPLRPSFLEPIDPGIMEPDIGAIMAPYNARNVPLGARDVDTAGQIFQRNYQFVSMLPDIRSMAPGFIRPLIPNTWRRSIAEAFTGATINAQIRSDYPTPLEAADLSFYRLTGVSTTMIPIPGFSF
jgi:hypothetical protein